MKILLPIILVGALAGCAQLEEVGRSIGGAVSAGVEAVAGEVPEAVEELANDPSPGTAGKVGVGLIITFITGAAGYFAVKRYKKV